MTFDPRLEPEFDGQGRMPFSDQGGSGELAALAIGASLGDMANYSQAGDERRAHGKGVQRGGLPSTPTFFDGKMCVTPTIYDGKTCMSPTFFDGKMCLYRFL